MHGDDEKSHVNPCPHNLIKCGLKLPLCYGRYLQDIFLKFSQLNLSLFIDFIKIAVTSGSEEFLWKKTIGRAPLGILGKNLCSNATKYYDSKVYGLWKYSFLCKAFFQLNYQSTKWHQFRISTYIALVFFYFEHLRPSLCHLCKIKSKLYFPGPKLYDLMKT